MWHIIGEQPTCKIDGCNNKVAESKKHKEMIDMAYYRSICSFHHLEKIAKKAGFETIADYKNSKHSYRYARKEYCENIDGRLGYVCTSTVRRKSQLHVDHIDGNPDNNCEENLQTLCLMCHEDKTITNKDRQTPGRGSVKKPKELEMMNTAGTSRCSELNLLKALMGLMDR